MHIYKPSQASISKNCNTDVNMNMVSNCNPYITIPSSGHEHSHFLSKQIKPHVLWNTAKPSKPINANVSCQNNALVREEEVLSSEQKLN